MNQDYAERFTNAWMMAAANNGDVWMVCQVLGCTRTKAIGYASSLRGKGVRLPVLNSRLNVAKLNAIVDRFDLS